MRQQKRHHQQQRHEQQAGEAVLAVPHALQHQAVNHAEGQQNYEKGADDLRVFGILQVVRVQRVDDFHLLCGRHVPGTSHHVALLHIEIYRGQVFEQLLLLPLRFALVFGEVGADQPLCQVDGRFPIGGGLAGKVQLLAKLRDVVPHRPHLGHRVQRFEALRLVRIQRLNLDGVQANGKALP